MRDLAFLAVLYGPLVAGRLLGHGVAELLLARRARGRRRVAL